jgi:predicted phage terminase large subunit-like protein
VIIGTVIHDESLLGELLQTPGYDAKVYRAVIRFAEREDLWAEWKEIFTDLSRNNPEEEARAFFKENREEMLKGTEILWDQGNPNFTAGYYSLMVARIVDGEGSFASELQNDPRSSEERFFKPRTYNDDQLPPLQQMDIVMAVDPSMGETDKSDFSAIIALGTERKTGQMYVLVADIQRRHPDKIIEDLFVHAQYLLRGGLKLRAVGVESVQFQAFFKDECAKRAKRYRLHLPIMPVYSSSKKELRIDSLEPSINNGYVLIHEKHILLLQQLENYPKGKKDGPDALEMAVDLARQKTRRKAGTYRRGMRR